ncbi:MAG: leucine-rich repeat protein, partial [Clostridia bacterium]|nr:leucine-rich repeat protein [Clostridia bacterium]
FSGCTSLTLAVMRDGVSLIDNSAFSGCTSLSEVYFGAGLERIGISAFYACTSVRAFYYSADRDSFNRITFSSTPINSDLVICGVGYGRVSIEIPISTPTKSIKALTVGGEEYSFTAKTRNGLIYALIISSEDEYALDGLTATALGEIDADSDRHISASTSFTAYDEGEVNGADAILGCTVCEAFDGRIFLSGNERLPNTVFYSSRDASGKNNPLYFGAYNYFNDGTGGFGVESMLAAGDSLAVFKSGDSGDGSIYYHTPKETGIDILPKIYPVSYIHSGICAVGPSISFFDDPIFLSKTGVMALGKRAVNLERSVSVRSHNVNALLLAEDLKSACLARWCGYLFLLTGERAYLADSRATFTHKTGSVEYEWYYLNGIGTYRGDRQVFRYSPIARSGYSVHEAADEIVSTIVGSATHPDGNIIYFTIENGKKYEVYPDGEMRGGTLSPATALCCADGDLLFFGTECGDVCIFNNDKRGVAPPKDGEAQNTDEEYKRLFARRIHPYYYSFAGHAPRYALRTVADDGGFPNTTKCTEKHSLTVKLRSLGSGSFVCETGTEAGGYKEIAELPDFALSFFELDFSTLSFFNSDYTTLPLKEKEKGWIEKTVGFYSEKHRSPFGICAVTYRFRLKGKIKL